MATRGKKSAPSFIPKTNDEYIISMIKEMNRMNTTEGLKEAVSYLSLFASKKNLLQKGAKVPAKGYGAGTLTFGWVAAMSLNGFPLKSEDEMRVTEFIIENSAKNTEKDDEITDSVVEKTKPNIQDAINAKAAEFIGNLEGVIDDADFSFNMDNSLKSAELGLPVIKIVEKWLKRKNYEFSEILTTDDKELKNSYKHINSKKMVAMLEKWQNVVDTALQHKKANRKPITKKQKTPLQQTAKLKVLKTFELTPGSSIQGLPATSLIGVEQAWVYNTKTKKITVYRSPDNRIGIQCRGTSLQNFDVTNSECRTLRKPAEFIKEVNKAGKVALRKLIDTLTTKATPANGRLNEHSIIIRVL
jgi:hypothetical protein